MSENKFLPVSEWADDDKPREKMHAQGKKAMSNAELIAILLRNGSQGQSAVELAKQVLAAAGGSLTALARMDHAQLARIKGMALAKTSSVMAALELGWRMHREIGQNRTIVLGTSQETFLQMHDKVVDLDHEEFWAAFLNVRNQLLDMQRISVGGLSDTTVDLRVLFRCALEAKASRMAVMHNHPTGNLKPSQQDNELTRRIAEAGRMLGIQLMDHLIVGIVAEGKADYFSYRDHHLL